MDQQGSLLDTNIKIYPSTKLIEFLKSLPEDNVPANILKIKGMDNDCKKSTMINKTVQLNDKDYGNLNKIKDIVKEKFGEIEDSLGDKEENIEGNDKLEQEEIIKESEKKANVTNNIENNQDKNNDRKDCEKSPENITEETHKEMGPYLITTDIDWLYTHLKDLRSKSKEVPYLNVLLEGSTIEMPENEIIKRNPILEARCVKLRAQQEAREYRKMTKTVDNVRLRFPEDSISYQLKQLNRQLIAVVQFLLSIFAGFLFGFKGVEWMIGNLDFGFRLLLGVMCALIIALAEIYFLAKKLNEELNVPETVQLGGPPKFAEDSPYATYNSPRKVLDKEHID